MANSSPQKVTINERAAARLRRGHVWVYASDVLNDTGTSPGSLVHVVGPTDKVLGSAVYSSSSQIKLRMLGRELLNTEEELMRVLHQRLAEAMAYRKRMVQDSDACRLVFSEADRLPGLIIDRYSDVFTFQVLTQAWDQPKRKQAIVAGIQELTQAEHVAERVDARIRELEQLAQIESTMASGTKSSTTFTMNGVRFLYDAMGGQKTGAFLDQRENYMVAAKYARGEALDVCTYQGGFALHLARVCERVTALDISREMLEIAEQNEKLNATANRNEIEWIEANAFDLLKDYSVAGRQYDVIVLDPPAFAKSKKHLAAAMRGYKELNLRTMRMLRPGGTLITCTCSSAVTEEDFGTMLTDAAQDAHRPMRLIETHSQAKDHPILLGVPESHYLKCFVVNAI